MVQTRTTDGGNSLRRHWLHGKQENSRTGTAQRDSEGILNLSRLYADRKTSWCLTHQLSNPAAIVTPVMGQQKADGVWIFYRRSWMASTHAMFLTDAHGIMPLSTPMLRTALALRGRAAALMRPGSWPPAKAAPANPIWTVPFSRPSPGKTRSFRWTAHHRPYAVQKRDAWL